MASNVKTCGPVLTLLMCVGKAASSVMSGHHQKKLQVDRLDTTGARGRHGTMGRVCCGQIAYFAGEEKVGVEQYTVISWEILEGGEKWHCVIVYIFSL